MTGEIAGQGYDGPAAVDVRVSMSDGRLVLSLGGIKMPKATVSARYAAYLRENDEGDED